MCHKCNWNGLTIELNYNNRVHCTFIKSGEHLTNLKESPVVDTSNTCFIDLSFLGRDVVPLCDNKTLNICELCF